MIDVSGPRGKMAAGVIYKLLLGAVCVFLAYVFSGCCTYQGKVVSHRDAERMKKLGMDVQCR